MSAHLTEWLPLTVLLASLGGSFHCVSMCGGLMVASAQTRLGVVGYQIGRLLGYASFGALAGAFGSTVFSNSNRNFSAIAASIVISILFFVMALKTWNGRAPHFQIPVIFHKIYSRVISAGGFATGLFSVFLPCGWLHSFVLGAATTGSAIRGALFMGLFWMGTVPAMSTAPIVIQKVFRPFMLKMPKFAASLMLAAGLATLGFRTMPMIRGQSMPSHSNHLMNQNTDQSTAQSIESHPDEMGEYCHHH